MAVAGSLEVQGASSPETTYQWAGGLEGEVSGTLWREGSRYMATVKGKERSKKGELGTQRARKKQSSERLPFSYTRPWKTPTQRKRASQPPKGFSLPVLACHNNILLNIYGPSYVSLSLHVKVNTLPHLPHDPPFLEPYPPSRSLGTKWAAALVFLTRFPFMTRPSLSRPRYQARPERR